MASALPRPPPLLMILPLRKYFFCGFPNTALISQSGYMIPSVPSWLIYNVQFGQIQFCCNGGNGFISIKFLQNFTGSTFHYLNLDTGVEKSNGKRNFLHFYYWTPPTSLHIPCLKGNTEHQNILFKTYLGLRNFSTNKKNIFHMRE